MELISKGITDMDVLTIILGLRSLQDNHELFAEVVVENAERLEILFCNMVYDAHA